MLHQVFTRDPQTSRICGKCVWVSNRNRMRFLALRKKILLYIHSKPPPWTQEGGWAKSKVRAPVDSPTMFSLPLDGWDNNPAHVGEKTNADKYREQRQRRGERKNERKKEGMRQRCITRTHSDCQIMPNLSFGQGLLSNRFICQ